MSDKIYFQKAGSFIKAVSTNSIISTLGNKKSLNQ